MRETKIYQLIGMVIYFLVLYGFIFPFMFSYKSDDVVIMGVIVFLISNLMGIKALIRILKSNKNKQK